VSDSGPTASVTTLSAFRPEGNAQLGRSSRELVDPIFAATADSKYRQPRSNNAMC